MLYRNSKAGFRLQSNGFRTTTLRNDKPARWLRFSSVSLMAAGAITTKSVRAQHVDGSEAARSRVTIGGDF
jgi:hypothetical protein